MLDDNKNVIKTFSSYTDAFNYLNIPFGGQINKYIKNNKKIYGYFWSLN